MNLLDRMFKTKEQRTAIEVSKLYKGTFETELGKRCLEHLVEVFVDRDMYQQGMTLEQVAFKQGEASVIKKIAREAINTTKR